MSWMTEGTGHEQGGVRQSLGRRLGLALETREKVRTVVDGGQADNFTVAARRGNSLPGTSLVV